MMRRVLCLVGGLLGLMLACGLLATPAAKAAPLCRPVADHQVCVLKMTRSAKYYWEYRALVQIDGKNRPMARYNCRTREYVRRDGERIRDDVATEVICKFFKP